jgi:hypothetical protein
VSDVVLPFVWRHLDHVLAVLLLISRLGDIGPTYLITPRLRLESNPIVRRLGWRFVVASILLCLVPYFNEAAGVMILVPFLLVAAANARSLWFARAIGEEEYHAMLMRAVRRSRLVQAVVPIWVSAGFTLMIGLVVLLFYPDPSTDWGFWVGTGVLLYAFIVALYGTLTVRRLFRQGAATPSAEMS